MVHNVPRVCRVDLSKLPDFLAVFLATPRGKQTLYLCREHFLATIFQEVEGSPRSTIPLLVPLAIILRDGEKPRREDEFLWADIPVKSIEEAPGDRRVCVFHSPLSELRRALH